MTSFLRLILEKDKAVSLAECCSSLREGLGDARVFNIDPTLFRMVPGAPFSYWAGEDVLSMFRNLPPLESENRTAQHGGSTKDDFRFVRQWVEVENTLEGRWMPFAKGGAFSLFYSDVFLTVNWHEDARELEAALLHKYPYLGNSANWVLHRECHYGVPGLTWPSRTLSGLGMRVMPAGCIFSSKGPAVFIDDGDIDSTLSLLAVLISTPFRYLVSLQMASVSYEVGVIQNTPVPKIASNHKSLLSALAKRAWSLKFQLDTVDETSHAFYLPVALRDRLGSYDPLCSESQLNSIRSEIDEIAFGIYEFGEENRAAALGLSGSIDEESSLPAEDGHDSEADVSAEAVDQTDGLLSWATGVAFGRFDWRLATGERAAPPEPEPFDPLPAKSPGMLPDDAKPFHAHSSILVDDQGHPNDLARLIEEVLARVEAPVPADVRRWLQRDFFKFHLGQYSKSRRKAPIYWPISTSSGSYTLWLYYPNLTDQTLFTAVNDFIEPKMKQVDQDVVALRTKGSARSRDDEKTFEALQTLELDLIELRDTLLAIAQTYHPNHDDGVQITAAPLWQLFRHKPWQKVLKDTWAKLEKGDYDWAHLAMAYWPDRVREKCETDKSLAIAHELEHLYVEPEPKPTKARGRKKDG